MHMDIFDPLNVNVSSGKLFRRLVLAKPLLAQLNSCKKTVSLAIRCLPCQIISPSMLIPVVLTAILLYASLGGISFKPSISI